MAETTEARIPITNESMQHWIKLPGASTYLRVTEDTSASTEREANTYEPTYLDRKVQPKYNIGRTDTFSFEIDAHTGGGIHSELVKIEDEQDVAIEYVRTLDFDFETGKSVAQTALVAKHATAKLNVNPLSTDDIAPLKISGTIVIESEYDYGTFNATTGTFSAKTDTSALTGK